MIKNILLALGVVCIAAAVYLAAGYARYLSEINKLISLLLLTAFFGFLGKYLEERGM